MDNLRTHKIACEAIEAVDVELRYLSVYSPDLNPIELAFFRAKGGAAQRRRTHDRRTPEAHWQTCEVVCAGGLRQLL